MNGTKIYFFLPVLILGMCALSLWVIDVLLSSWEDNLKSYHGSVWFRSRYPGSVETK